MFAAKWKRMLSLLALTGALFGCAPSDPVRIGFIGGVSGRVADLGISGRNATQLAIEIRNKSGGINGRRIELIVEDDGQDPEQARQAASLLIAQKVDAIIGPMTSMVAMAALPLVNEAKITMVSPTVSTAELSGLDDYFLRVISPTTQYAHKSADYQYERLGIRRVAIAYDLRNRAYSESWLKDYGEAFGAHGGKILHAEPFLSGDNVDFTRLAKALLGARPDAVLIIANSVDTAMLAQQVRKRDQAITIATSEWAATERLTELGGRAVDGMVIAQFLDRESTLPAYREFHQAYVERFSLEPGFGGTTAFDATSIVLTALGEKKKGQTLKEAILSRKTFSGLQSEIRFDEMGDARRETYMTAIWGGRFVRLH